MPAYVAGPVRQPYEGVNFIPLVRDYEFDYCKVDYYNQLNDARRIRIDNTSLHIVLNLGGWLIHTLFIAYVNIHLRTALTRKGTMIHALSELISSLERNIPFPKPILLCVEDRS